MTLLLAVLADASPAPSTDPEIPDLVSTGSWAPGLLSLAAFVFLALAIWIIYRSMNSQLRKVHFEERRPPDGTAPSGGTAPSDRTAPPDHTAPSDRTTPPD